MTKNNHLAIIILAAGKGTRMKSDLPKVMHKVAGCEMLNLVLLEAKKMNPKDIAVVVSDDFYNYQSEISKKHTDLNIKFVPQAKRLGTAHAVLTGLAGLYDKSQEKPSKILVLYGDTPLITTKTLETMAQKINNENSLCVLGFKNNQENQYGRLVIDKNKNLEQIVEFKDASPEQKEIEICNSGVMAILGDKIDEYLSQINNENAANEYYLTDLVQIARKNNDQCAFVTTFEDEVLGVNSRLELARVEDIKQNKLRQHFMENGVTMRDPFSVYFCHDTKIEQDVTIEQNVVFGENVSVKSNSVIKSFSYLEGVKIDSGCFIGPFARVRGKSELGENVKIGNFVEVKNSKLGKNTKSGHLSYLGDSKISENVNIGAGVVTCNYDGFSKYTTKIDDGVFVGSNSSLIAPIEIKRNSLIGAGSVVTENIDENDLAISRVKQKNIKSGAKRIRELKDKK